MIRPLSFRSFRICLWRTLPLLAATALAGTSDSARTEAAANPSAASLDAGSPAPAGAAATSNAKNGNGEQRTITRFPGLFEIDLPKTEKRGQIRFVFHPSFRDLINRGYIRVPLGMRWGVNDHVEVNSDVDTHFDHGLKKGYGSNGLTALHFGGKYACLHWLKPTWDTSIGLNTSFPVSRPPLDLTDGLNHISPYIAFGRKIDDIKGLSGYINLSADFVSHSSTPGGHGRNQMRSNSVQFAPGILYDWHAWHFTLETHCATTRVLGSGCHDYFTVRPGVVWDLPKKLVFNSKGRWMAGFNITAVWGPDGHTIDTGERLRAEVSLTQLFYRYRQPKPAGDSKSSN